MKFAVFVFLACLLCVVVTGQRESKGRCRCQGKGVRFVPQQKIQTLTMYTPDQSCSNIEIIVTLKGNGGKKCIDPESDIAKKFMEKAQEKMRAKKADPTVIPELTTI
ncbi:C-X-C motif chemokine 11-6-like [Alosa sapidissima]|uniref:C-X-C motif chemokine 11-6-like n=1 Tax=Alosa sapidissima TaxID=34773 RepID=UPI001C08F4F2|nr:C-X-C motif chemokine 11-6-like [Alosa sapidissima]XP_041957032.1 C-X-C motif chemokine 11-6-like [Alosa sapidissima]